MLQNKADSRSGSLGSLFFTLPAIKAVGISAFMMVFFFGYFWVLRHPIRPVAIMPVTWVDQLVPFSPWATWLYFSLWIYVSLCAGLFCEVRRLVVYGAFAASIGLVGLAIYVVWPTSMPRPTIDWALYPGLNFLKALDRSGNACPSLHVAYAVFSCVWADCVLSNLHVKPIARFLNIFWCASIVYSTMAIRQHVAIDVLCGALLGATGAMAHLDVQRRILSARPAASAIPQEQASL